MAEYIEREAALTEFAKVCDICMALMAKPTCGECSVADTVRKIKHIPAADVVPVVRGKWIKYAPHNSDLMTCSKCEKYWILDGDQYDYHYCPSCGARMGVPDADVVEYGR